MLTLSPSMPSDYAVRFAERVTCPICSASIEYAATCIACGSSLVDAPKSTLNWAIIGTSCSPGLGVAHEDGSILHLDFQIARSMRDYYRCIKDTGMPPLEPETEEEDDDDLDDDWL